MTSQEPQPQPQPPAPRKGKARKILIITGAVILALIVIGTLNRKTDTATGTQPATAPVVPSSSAPVISTSVEASSPEPKPPSTPPTTTQAPTPSPTPSPTEVPFEAKNYTGSGDDVVAVETPVGKASVLTFTCEGCSGNVVVRSDSSDGLLVNEIGAYTGSRLVDEAAGDQTSQVEIQADADWTMSIADASQLPSSGLAATGRGDAVVRFDGDARKVTFTHDGEANFAVSVFSANGTDLAVNEIGTYSGTVPLKPPAFLEITADGNWTATAS